MTERSLGGAKLATSPILVWFRDLMLPFFLRFAANPTATIVFARYGTPGVHRQSLDGADALDIRLGRNGFIVAPLPKDTAP